MFNIRNKLIQITQGGNFQLPTGTGYLESWVYHVVQSVINVNEGVTEDHGMADLFQQQIDVRGVPFLHTLNYLPVLRNAVIANG